MTEEREKKFRKRMDGFPSHFDLHIKFGFTTVIKKLNAEMETTGFELEAELTRAFNFLSFVHWRIGDYKSAKMYLEKSLSKRQNDVMALANRAWMHWKRREVSEAQSILEKLEKFKHRQDLIVISKAEQAFAYTRFGPKYYKKAIEIFINVIDTGAEFKLEETYINLWKFGLGISLKRQLQVMNVFSFDHLSTPVDSFRHAISVLLDVAQNANTSRYKARGWVALGELADSIHNQEMLSPQDKELLPKEFTCKTPVEFFDTAFSICNNDVYVLERCGRQARLSKDYNKSIQLLRQSIEIRGTSLSHHHLAKAIRSTLNKDISDKKKCQTNQTYFCTPVVNVCVAGYNKFHNIQGTRRNLFPDCEQNREDLKVKNIPRNSSEFKNNPISLSSSKSSAASSTVNIKCTDNIQSDSGIFSLNMTDSLAANFASVTISDSTSSPSFEMKESRQPERQASNILSDDQACAAQKEHMIISHRYDPSIIGGHKRQFHTTYRRFNYETSLRGLRYQNTYALKRGRSRRAQGEGRGIEKKLSRGQSSYPVLQRNIYFQDSTSTFNNVGFSQNCSPGGQKRPENRPFATPSQCQQPKIVMPIRSPRKVLRYLPNDERVTDIEYHLDQSIKYSPSNCSAKYDKGLLFRSLDRLQDAIDMFIKIREEKDCSPWQAVLCMEQQALCLQEIAEKEIVPDEREALITDIKELLFEAMEQVASIATRFPFYQPRVTAFPSLKEILLRQFKFKKCFNRDHLKDIARLYELVGKYGYALSFYKQICDMSEEDSKDPEIILKMAQNYVKQNDFYNSLLLFNLIETSCTNLEGDNRKYYFEAYLEGALYALKQDDVKEAKTRFKKTVRFCRQIKLISEGGDEECDDECSYDIHIQTSEDAEGSCMELFDLLTRTCGLKVSLNDNHITEELKYDGIREGIRDIMEQSCLIIFIFLDDADPLNRKLRFFIETAVDLNLEYGTGLISICQGESNVPGCIKSFPVFVQQTELKFSADKKPETYQWLRDFFRMAAKQTFHPSVSNEPNETDSD